MITVHWNGRLGNQLFQYALGRILAEEFDYSMDCGSLEGFPVTFEKVTGSSIESQVQVNGHFFDWDMARKNKGKLGFILNGWFQQYDYYQPYKERIRKWFNAGRVSGSVVLSSKDIAIHIRRTQSSSLDTKVAYVAEGGFLKIGQDRVKHGLVLSEGSVYAANEDLLPVEFYTTILDKQTFDNLIICTDCPEDPFLSYFEKYHPKIISGNIIDDFNIMRSAARIIMSMSTFSWWSSFLSDAEKIYMPIPNYAAWGPQSPVRLQVTDEARYELVPVVRNNGTFF